MTTHQNVSPPTVFLVATGTQDDYAINSIWTTRDAAQKYVDSTPLDCPEITEMVINNETKVDLTTWVAWVKKGNDGTWGISVRNESSQCVNTTSVSYSSYHKRYVGHGYGATSVDAMTALMNAIAEAKAAETQP